MYMLWWVVAVVVGELQTRGVAALWLCCSCAGVGGGDGRLRVGGGLGVVAGLQRHRALALGSGGQGMPGPKGGVAVVGWLQLVARATKA